MKLLALFVVFILLFLLVFFLRINIDLAYNFCNYESRLNLRIRILFLTYKINLLIPKELILKGYNTFVQNLINDLTEREKHFQDEAEVSDRTKPKSRRYRALKFRISEIISHYMTSWFNLINVVRQLNKIKNYFYSKINIYLLHITIEVGGRDAAETGILTGAIWGFLGQMTARIYRRCTVRKNNIRYNVLPNFQDIVFSLSVQGILSLKISHIIFTAYKLLVFSRKRRIRNNG